MRPFSKIEEVAIDLKGSLENLTSVLPKVKSDDELENIPDDRWLAAMAVVIFRSGFSWKVVANKWPGFEEAFVGFDPNRVAMFSDEDLDRLVSDKGIIRNGQKIRAVQDNAIFLTELAREHGSAARYIAAWPTTNFVGLWNLLKKQGSRLGGKSGAYFLREIGKDTPVMSNHVVAALSREGVIDKEPTSQKDLASVQDAFNEWHTETGYPMAHISRMLAASID